MSTIELANKELIMFENRMRKYLQIIPNRSQTVINSEAIDFSIDPDNVTNINNLKLGSELNEDSLWNYNSDMKYFKIRLESKKTGKKIDLNLRFKFLKPT